MTSREFRDRLSRRLYKSHVPVPEQPVLAQLETFFNLLARWNAKINLTALPLERPTEETFDRLFVEPLAAARHVPGDGANWFDVGTGGGSPALPLKILRPSVRLTMVESKVRKAAFLREAIRALDLSDAFVENSRFEEIAQGKAGTSQLVTVRAVRPDSALATSAAGLLKPGGRLLLFRPSSRPLAMDGFAHLETIPLLEGRNSFLGMYGRVFHVEQPG